MKDPAQTAWHVLRALRRHATPKRAELCQRFFQTHKGGYGEGDRFLGVTVPDIRRVARAFRDLSVSQTQRLIASPWHEARQCGLFILCHTMRRASEPDRRRLHTLYLASIPKSVNNWDLVDSTAEEMVGRYLFGRSTKCLDRLARSRNLWNRRVAIIATFAFIKNGDPEPTLRISRLLLHDPHPLIHKATGWMLREVGRRCGPAFLNPFLTEHASVMPRTMLRYAIEHMPPDARRFWMRFPRP